MNKEYTKHLKPAAAAGWRESWSETPGQQMRLSVT